MSGGIAFAVAALIAVWFGHRQAVPIAIPFVLLWVSAPAVAHWISLLPKQAEDETLSASDTADVAHDCAPYMALLRDLHYARKTIGCRLIIFRRIRSRSSPTALLRQISVSIFLRLWRRAISAGWERRKWLSASKATLQTIAGLEKFRGHLCNWYETLSLKPLEPKYVSSVDSGNLAGDLITLAAACRQLIQQPAVEPNILEGVQDAIALLREALDKLGDTSRLHAVTPKQLRDAVNALADSTRPFSGDAADWGARILELFRRAQTVTDMAQALAQELRADADSELQTWAQAAKAAIDSHLRDARVLLPWLRLSDGNPLSIATNGSLRPAEWTEIEAFFRNDSTLADAPERFVAAATRTCRFA